MMGSNHPLFMCLLMSYCYRLKLCYNNSMINTIDYYNKNYEPFIQSTRDVVFNSTQDKFLDKVSNAFSNTKPKNISLIDFGCGSGRDVKYFKDKGFSIEAIDGCAELCKAASDYSGVEVKEVLFQDWKPSHQFHGIWACASILHLPKNELLDVLKTLSLSLIENGILYTSFKYSDFEGERHGRYFTDFTEDSFKTFISVIKELKIIDYWISSDARPNRENEKWLNLILQRQ